MTRFHYLCTHGHSDSSLKTIGGASGIWDKQLLADPSIVLYCSRSLFRLQLAVACSTRIWSLEEAKRLLLHVLDMLLHLFCKLLMRAYHCLPSLSMMEIYVPRQVPHSPLLLALLPCSLELSIHCLLWGAC